MEIKIQGKKIDDYEVDISLENGIPLTQLKRESFRPDGFDVEFEPIPGECIIISIKV